LTWLESIDSIGKNKPLLHPLISVADDIITTLRRSEVIRHPFLGGVKDVLNSIVLLNNEIVSVTGGIPIPVISEFIPENMDEYADY
jgi:hypothetical protein